MKEEFEQLRLSILTQGKNTNDFTDAYLQAWDGRTFPFLHLDEAAEFGHPIDRYNKYFDLTVEQMMKIVHYLNTACVNKTYPFFWNFERDFGGQYDEDYGRGNLVYACRYLYLSDCFNSTLWNTLGENERHPCEAKYIYQPFSRKSISLS